MEVAHRDLDLQLVWRAKQMGLCDRVFQWHRLLPSSVPNTKTGNREGAWDWEDECGSGGAAGSPLHSHLTTSRLRFLPIPTSFRENPLWFFIARCKGLRKGSFVEAELEFFARCRSRRGTWFLVPFFIIKPLPSSFISREPTLFLDVFLIKPLIFFECFGIGPCTFL